MYVQRMNVFCVIKVTFLIGMECSDNLGMGRPPYFPKVPLEAYWSRNGFRLFICFPYPSRYRVPLDARGTADKV